MRTAPDISVVMTVYNRQQYVAEAIESVLGQTMGAFEFIIVNDGSTDASRSVIDQYRDKRIQTINLPSNVGIPTARNIGLRASRGTYIAVQDSDDISLPERFATQLACLRENHDVGVLGTGCRFIDSEGQTTVQVLNSSGGHDLILKNILRRQGGVSIAQPTVVMRKECVSKVGGYRDRFPVSEDIDLWLRMSQVCKLQVIPDICLLYRRHAGSASITERSSQLLSGILTRACHHLRQKGLPDPSAADVDQRWQAFREHTQEVLDRHKLFDADWASVKLSLLLSGKTRLGKFAGLILLLSREPGLAVAFGALRKWRRVLREVTELAAAGGVDGEGGALASHNLAAG